MSKVCAVGIKELRYADPSVVEELVKAKAKLSIPDLKTTLTNWKKVNNIHQDTWTLEEAEASQDMYRDQLTGGVYRAGKKTMGDITVNWTIGQYDYATKAEFLGGDVNSDGNVWARQRGIVHKEFALFAVTDDDQYVLFPRCTVRAREANTDGAIGLGVAGTVLVPDNEKLSSEYWFDKSALDAVDATGATKENIG